MAVTVEDLLQLAFPPGTRVLAGRSGLLREVTWARSLRPRPPAFEALEGGELALVSSAHLSLLDEPVTLAYLLVRLADVRVSAVAVLGEVNAEAIEAAETRGVPLIQLPPDTSLMDVERAAIATVVDRQAELQRRATDIYRQLSQLTLEERGLQAVVDRLGEITGKTVVLEDEQFRIQYSSARGQFPLPQELDLRGNRVAVEEWLRTVPLSSTQPPVSRFSLSGTPYGRYLAPIAVRDGVVGYLSVVGVRDELTDLDRVVTGRAAAVCAVEVSKEAAVGEAEARMRGDLLDQLLSAGVEEDQAIFGKAQRLGYDPSLPSVVLTFRAGAEGKGGGVPSPWGADRLRRKLESVLRVEMTRREPRSLVASRGSMVVAVVPMQATPSAKSARELAEGIRTRTQAMLESHPVAVGIGRPTQNGTGLVVSFREAERALAIGIRLSGPSSSTYFGDLGILRLLAQVTSLSELEGFHGEMLGKLEEHDRRSGGELTKTLEAFFYCHGNLTRTAEHLSLHRNSLLYRLQRVAEITGHNLEDPETRLSLQAALKVRQLLEAERGRRS